MCALRCIVTLVTTPRIRTDGAAAVAEGGLVGAAES
jgi:hypothetical protein